MTEYPLQARLRHGGGSHDESDHGNWADGRFVVEWTEGGRGFASGGVADLGGRGGGPSGESASGSVGEALYREWTAVENGRSSIQTELQIRDEDGRYYYVRVQGWVGTDPDFPEDGITGFVDVSTTIEGQHVDATLEFGPYGVEVSSVSEAQDEVAQWIESQLAEWVSSSD